MNEKEKDIRQLLDRFMAGTTSLDEESRLGEWFRTHPHVSDDLKEYQMMFGYFDDGMPLKTPAKRRRLWMPVSIAAGIAMILGMAFALMQQPQSQPLPLAQNQSRQESSRGKSPALTMPEEQSDSLDGLTEHQRDTVKEKLLVPRMRRYRKHLFTPAPPVNLLAQAADAVTDSLISSPEAFADAHLREMEAQQNEMFFKLYLVNALQTESLNADVASASFESEEDVHDEDHASDDQEVY